MVFTDWYIRRALKSEARRLAKFVASAYPESRARNPTANERDVVMGMSFDLKRLPDMSEKPRRMTEACCETVQGYCYLIAQHVGPVRGRPRYWFIHLSYYIDRELAAVGFPPRPGDQKQRTLAAMGMDMPGWQDLEARLRQGELDDAVLRSLADYRKINPDPRYARPRKWQPCPKCGYEVRRNVEFCRFCGSKLWQG